MEVVEKAKGRHRIKIYQKDGQGEAKRNWKLFCKRFSDEAHIKSQYISYIIRCFAKTIKEMIAEGRVVKIPGLGDFYLDKTEDDEVARYTPLYGKYIYAGVKPRLRFKTSLKWEEALAREIIIQDSYIHDPIAFDSNVSFQYIRYYKEKNRILKQLEIENGRTCRPTPIYTTEDIDNLCIEYGIEYPPFEGIKDRTEIKEFYYEKNGWIKQEREDF